MSSYQQREIYRERVLSKTSLYRFLSTGSEVHIHLVFTFWQVALSILAWNLLPMHTNVVKWGTEPCSCTHTSREGDVDFCLIEYVTLSCWLLKPNSSMQLNISSMFLIRNVHSLRCSMWKHSLLSLCCYHFIVWIRPDPSWWTCLVASMSIDCTSQVAVLLIQLNTNFEWYKTRFSIQMTISFWLIAKIQQSLNIAQTVEVSKIYCVNGKDLHCEFMIAVSSVAHIFNDTKFLIFNVNLPVMLISVHFSLPLLLSHWQCGPSYLPYQLISSSSVFQSKLIDNVIEHDTSWKM